jgi:hypothetical protein
MKDNLLILCILIGFATSCSNDFDLQANGDSIPVVYFLMNPADSNFKLTLTKTFSGDESGYDMAQDPNNLYFEKADIRLEGWSGQYKSWESKFDLTDQSKDPGIFNQSRGYCYEMRNDYTTERRDSTIGVNYLDVDGFRLVINLPGMKVPVISMISYVPLPVRTDPVTPLKVLDLCPDGSNYKAGIQFEKNKVKYCELICLFRYQVYQPNNESWLDDSVSFSLRKNLPIFGDKAITILDPEFFFTRLARNITPINDTIVRKFKSLDLNFLVGDQNFQTYYTTYVNSGLVDTQPVGNIGRGLGLFAMVRTIKIEKKMTMTYRTLDFLSTSEFTKQLGFIKW